MCLLDILLKCYRHGKPIYNWFSSLFGIATKTLLLTFKVLICKITITNTHFGTRIPSK